MFLWEVLPKYPRDIIYASHKIVKVNFLELYVVRLVWNQCAVNIGARFDHSSRAIIFQIKVRRVLLSEKPSIMHLLSPSPVIDFIH
jgi:hypothetical protein